MKRVDFDIKNTDIENLIYHLARYKFVARQLDFDKGKRILEVGCGMGYGSYFLSKYATKVDGVDNSVEVIKYANRTYSSKNLSFKCLDLTEKGNEHTLEAPYDAVICFEVIEHMKRERALELLKTINRLKKKSGAAYISTPRYLTMQERTENRRKHHIHEYTLKELKEDLSNVFQHSIFLGQIDEAIGSFNMKNVWTFFTVNI